jgi:hypothetical protein
LSSPFSSANLLLIGPEAAARAFLAPLMPALPSPVVFLDRAAPDLPQMPVGTLIVPNVARLTGMQQDQLLEWLSAESGSVRVVATSSRSLFAKVQHREFSERLYYRLNTVLVQLRARHSVSAHAPQSSGRLTRDVATAETDWRNAHAGSRKS